MLCAVGANARIYCRKLFSLSGILVLDSVRLFFYAGKSLELWLAHNYCMLCVNMLRC